MSNNSLMPATVIVGIAFTVLGLSSGPSPQAAATPGAGPTVEPQPTHQASPIRAWTLSLQQDSVDKPVGTPLEQVLARSQGYPMELEKAQGLGLRAIVVLVPDPAASRLPFDFDRTIEALSRAAEAEGFLLDQFAFNWQPDRGRRVELPSPTASSNVESDGAGPSPLGDYREQPSAMLFRRQPSGGVNPSRNGLLLLLVGEVPTGGVHRRALAKALTLAATVDSARRLTIVGPTYSGTAQSVADTLRLWQETNGALGRTLHAISGSATSPAVSATLSPWWVTQELFDDGTALTRLCQFVQDRTRVSRPRIGLLTEAGSLYGAIPSTPDTLQKCQILRVPFPMRIAELRRAFDRSGFSTTSGRASRFFAAPPSVPLTLTSTSQASDLPPVFTPDLTASAAEQNLRQTLGTLHRLDVDYVGLMASDTLDKLFLARMVRRYVPNSRLFTLESDQLFLHPLAAADSFGMLVVSSHSLEIRPDQSSLHNLSNGAIWGTHQALRRAIAVTSPTREKGGPWISIVGRTRFLTLESGNTGADDDVRGSRHDDRVRTFGHHRAWTIIYVLAFCGLAIWMKLVKGAAPMHEPNPPSLADSWPSATQWKTAPRETLRATARLLFEWQFAIIGTLLRRNGYVFLPMAIAMSMLAIALAVRKYLAVEQMIALGACVLLYVISIYLIRPDTPFRRHVWSWALVVLCVCLPFLGFALSPDWPTVDRMSDLSAGVTVLVPIGLLALASTLLVVAQVKRARTSFWLERLNPFPTHLSDKDNFGFTPFRRSVLDSLRFSARSGLRWTAVCLIMLAGIAAATDTPVAKVHTGESASLDVIINTMWLVTTLLLAITGAQVASAWRWLSRLMRRLAYHPLGSALDRLPEELASTLGIQWSSSPAHIETLGRPFEQLVLLRNDVLRQAGGQRPAQPRTSGTATGLAAAVATVVADGSRVWWERLSPEMTQLQRVMEPCELHKKFGNLMSESGSKNFDRSSHKTDLQHNLSTMASVCFDILYGYWDKRPINTLLYGSQKETTQLLLQRRAASDELTLRVLSEEQFLMVLLEDFVALQVLAFIGLVFHQIKTLLLAATATAVLFVFAAATYPFEPRQRLLGFVMTVVLMLSAGVLVLLIQRERHPLVSRVANTQPEHFSVTRSFMASTAQYVAIPLSAVLVTQFPTLSSALQSLIDTLLP